MRLLDLILRAEADARWASSPRAVLEVCVLKACEKPEEQDMQALLERLHELEGKLSRIESGQVAVRTAAPKTAASAAAALAGEEGPATAPPPPVNASDGEVWNKTVKWIKANSPALVGVSQGRFVGRKGNVWRLEFTEEKQFFIRMMNQDKNRQTIERGLAECGAEDPKFEAAAAENQARKRAEAVAEKSLDTLSDIFGRENIQVTDK